MNLQTFCSAITRTTTQAARVVRGFCTGLSMTLALMSPPSLAAPGDLDVSTFGPYSGLPYGQFPVTTSQFFKLHDAVVLPDDRIVAGGTCTATGATPAGTRFCIAVWTAAGSGAVLYLHSSTVNRVSPSAGGAIAAQPDGKIVVTAPCRYSAISGSVNQFCTVRFNADFTSDTGFATGFQNTSPSPSTNGDSYANAVALQPDGKIVVAGQCSAGTGTAFCAARLLPDGNPDSTFGGTSSLRTFVGVSTTASLDRVKRISLSTSGQIYLGGDCKDVTGLYRACVARLNADGSIDQPFTGTSFKPLVLPRMSESSADDEVTDMVMQANGEFVFAGACRNASSTIRVPCALRMGAPNATQFTPGSYYLGAQVSTGTSILREPVVPGTAVSIARIFMQTDGKMLALLQYGANFTQHRVRRYNEDGSIDANWNQVSFDFNAATDNASGFAVGLALGQQRSNKVIAMGFTQSINTANPQARVIRLDNRAPPGRSCSGDIDGDGQVLPTTDGLLLTRVAAGLTGNAVINGAIGANAPRNTWPEIRDYLITQCGMVVAP